MTEAQEKDEILEFIQNSNSPTGVEMISNICNSLYQLKKERAEMLCTIISSDGYIVYVTGPDGACKLTNKGRHFLEIGGYTREETIRQIKEEKATTKGELEIRQYRSVIATNDATKEAFIRQHGFNRNSLILAAVSVLFIVVSTVQQCTSKTDAELRGIREQMEETKATLDGIHTQLKARDSIRVIYMRPDTSGTTRKR